MFYLPAIVLQLLSSWEETLLFQIRKEFSVNRIRIHFNNKEWTKITDGDLNVYFSLNKELFCNILQTKSIKFHANYTWNVNFDAILGAIASLFCIMHLSNGNHKTLRDFQCRILFQKSTASRTMAHWKTKFMFCCDVGYWIGMK